MGDGEGQHQGQSVGFDVDGDNGGADALAEVEGSDEDGSDVLTDQELGLKFFSEVADNLLGYI